MNMTTFIIKHDTNGWKAGEAKFVVTTSIDDKVVFDEHVLDPLVLTRIRVSLLDRLRVLFGAKLEIQVRCKYASLANDIVNLIQKGPPNA